MSGSQPPSDLKYTETHEWARVEGNRATIGITDYAQDELGDVVYLDLPWDDAAGRDLKASDHFGDIESVKATSELFTPLSGRVVKVNAALKEHPELVNSDPFGEGWMLVIELSDPSEAGKLLSAEEYNKLLQTGSGH